MKIVMEHEEYKNELWTIGTSDSSWLVSNIIAMASYFGHADIMEYLLENIKDPKIEHRSK